MDNTAGQAQAQVANLQIGIISPDKWQEYKNLRLNALQSDPIAFGSSYEEEKQIPDKHWQERLEAYLRKDLYTMFFAQINGTLIGMMGVEFGKQIKTKHIANIFGVYVKEEYRSRDVGTKLLEATLKELATRPEIVKVKTDVNTQQPTAISMFKHYNFHIVGILDKELKIGSVYYNLFILEKMLR